MAESLHKEWSKRIIGTEGKNMNRQGAKEEKVKKESPF